ncbi:hypothetical protein GGX14DRAFT_336107, partial [Mycena pura]
RPNINGTRITLKWLKELRPRECLYRFRFNVHELEQLVHAMDIPNPFRTVSSYSFSAIEALCLLLARFKTAGDIYDLTMQYDRGASAISEIVNELTIFLDGRWKHLLDFDSGGILSPTAMQEYADAIHEAGAPVDSIWGFIDCTIRAI